MDQMFRFSYFGYTVEFSFAFKNIRDLREEANTQILAKFGVTPTISYVEPGVPFPAYVPADILTATGWECY
jgi:hypothetical protein